MYKAMVNVQKTQAERAEDNRKKMKEGIKARYSGTAEYDYDNCLLELSSILKEFTHPLDQ